MKIVEKTKTYVKEKIKQFLNSRFLLALTMLSIGISYTVIYYEAPEVLNPHVITVSADDTHATVTDAGTETEDDSAEETPIYTAEVSAYTSRVEETDGSPYVSADGTNLKEVYECVVASNDYEFGTRLAIEELGVCTVRDRLNSRYNGTGNIDVYMGNDLLRAKEFGRRTLNYIVIK